MRVLVGCEYSGRVRDAFLQRGHEALSCDLLPSEAGGPHYQGNVRDLLGQGWDLFIAFPDCTYLCSSGLHWNHRVPGRVAKTEAALVFVQELMDAPIPRIAIENPMGCIGTRIRPASQSIQPHWFGEDASKLTCLWLKGLPLLRPTRFVEPRIVIDASGRKKSRWANQTDSGQNRLPPSATRWKDRSRTYLGIAEAMADQWGNPEQIALAI